MKDFCFITVRFRRDAPHFVQTGSMVHPLRNQYHFSTIVYEDFSNVDMFLLYPIAAEMGRRCSFYSCPFNFVLLYGRNFDFEDFGRTTTAFRSNDTPHMFQFLSKSCATPFSFKIFLNFSRLTISQSLLFTYILSSDDCFTIPRKITQSLLFTYIASSDDCFTAPRKISQILFVLISPAPTPYRSGTRSKDAPDKTSKRNTSSVFLLYHYNTSWESA